MARLFTVNPLTALLVLWGVFIVYGTTIPFDFTLTLEDARNRLSGIRAGVWGVASIPDMVTNLLLFLPWGFLIAARLVQVKRGFFFALGIATVTGFLLSLSVETAQLFSPSRTSTPRDLLFNTASAFLGVPIGWLAASVFGPLVKAKQEQLVHERPFAGLAFVTALVLFFFALEPFNLTLDIGQLKDGLKAARPIPFGATLLGMTPPADPWNWGIEFLQWTLVGGVFALALRERGLPRLAVFFAGAALCGALSAVFEMAQIIVDARTTDATSVFFALTGGAFGALWISLGWNRSARDWIWLALGFWAIALMLARWTPPVFNPNGLEGMGWHQLIPFFAYYSNTNIFALADILIESLSYIVLGALLAARSEFWRTYRVVILAFCFGALLEGGQIFLGDRVAEITDALSAAFGAYLGCRLWAWASQIVPPEEARPLAENLDTPRVEQPRVVRPRVITPQTFTPQVAVSAVAEAQPVTPQFTMPEIAESPIAEPQVEQSYERKPYVLELPAEEPVPEAEELSIQVLPGYIIQPRPLLQNRDH